MEEECWELELERRVLPASTGIGSRLFLLYSHKTHYYQWKREGLGLPRKLERAALKLVVLPYMGIICIYTNCE